MCGESPSLAQSLKKGAKEDNRLTGKARRGRSKPSTPPLHSNLSACRRFFREFRERCECCPGLSRLSRKNAPPFAKGGQGSVVRFSSCSAVFPDSHPYYLPLSPRERGGVRAFSTKICGFPHPNPPTEGEGELEKERIESHRKNLTGQSWGRGGFVVLAPE